MFSSRFNSEASEPNPHWEALEALRASGTSVTDLTVSNPTLVGLPYPDSIPSLLAAGAFPYRPAPRGDRKAREAIAAYYIKANRRAVADDFLVTASTSEAYGYLFKLLCNPGDEVLIPVPTYPLFDALADLEGVKLVRYPQGDFDFLRRIISTRCKAVILVHPNNPTGHLVTSEEARAYLEIARDYHLSLIVDEVFSDYLFGDAVYHPIVSDGPLVFTLNGLSKLLALPQLKLGWIHVGGAPATAATALGHLEWIADAFLSVNGPVQAACPALLSLREDIQGPLRARLGANLAAARALGSASKRLRVPSPDAGWYVTVEVTPGPGGPVDEEEFALGLLQERRVYAHPGHLFGFTTGCRLVLSLLAPEAEFRDGFARVVAHAEAAR